ncbi:MAG TPA: A24 family peptidase [Haliangiales bacterium]|nr:A24 family peptidase [Haliangiales bacterium]
MVWTFALGIGIAAAAACDLRWRRIPNALNVAILVAGIAARAVAGASVVEGLAGALSGFVPLFLLFRAGWIGGGDVKLGAAAGAWLGPIPALAAVLGGLAAGGLLSLAVLAAGGRSLRAEVALNLKTAALSLSAPDAPRRARGKLVPMALALGGAALVVFARGGFA